MENHQVYSVFVSLIFHVDNICPVDKIVNNKMKNIAGLTTGIKMPWIAARHLFISGQNF
jgi:hypothetical protein